MHVGKIPPDPRQPSQSRHSDMPLNFRPAQCVNLHRKLTRRRADAGSTSFKATNVSLRAIAKLWPEFIVDPTPIVQFRRAMIRTCGWFSAG
jgi:hypothetical protein